MADCSTPSARPDTTNTGDLKDPPKQFIAVIGDDNGIIRPGLRPHLFVVPATPEFYTIDNYYYSAKFGIKEFAELSEFESSDESMPCLFLFFKSVAHLEQAGNIAEAKAVDTRVVIVESTEVCSKNEKLAETACKYEFEIHYLKHTDEEVKDAQEIQEKFYFERLKEIISVCCWPWRVTNVTNNWRSIFNDQNSSSMCMLPADKDAGFEEKKVEHFIDKKEAERMHQLYWGKGEKQSVVNAELSKPKQSTEDMEKAEKLSKITKKSISEEKQKELVKSQEPEKLSEPEKKFEPVKSPEPVKLPEPEKVEFVYLPSSPSDMEDGPLRLEDVSISVDIDLVCMKNLDNKPKPPPKA